MKVYLHLVAQEYVCNRMYDLSLCHAVYVLWGLLKETEREKEIKMCARRYSLHEYVLGKLLQI
jgi:hypothetical protein